MVGALWWTWFFFARESFGGALCLMWVVGESFERARWSSGFAQSMVWWRCDGVCLMKESGLREGGLDLSLCE